VDHGLSCATADRVRPGLCLTLAVLAVNFVGDGLRDAFDPMR
jgi:ABC-type dipeptide/oligopeptide/nickel transport system permease subunit